MTHISTDNDNNDNESQAEMTRARSSSFTEADLFLFNEAVVGGPVTTATEYYDEDGDGEDDTETVLASSIIDLRQLQSSSSTSIPSSTQPERIPTPPPTSPYTSRSDSLSTSFSETETETDTSSGSPSSYPSNSFTGFSIRNEGYEDDVVPGMGGMKVDPPILNLDLNLNPTYSQSHSYTESPISTSTPTSSTSTSTSASTSTVPSSRSSSLRLSASSTDFEFDFDFDDFDLELGGSSATSSGASGSASCGGNPLRSGLATVPAAGTGNVGDACLASGSGSIGETSDAVLPLAPDPRPPPLISTEAEESSHGFPVASTSSTGGTGNGSGRNSLVLLGPTSPLASTYPSPSPLVVPFVSPSSSSSTSFPSTSTSTSTSASTSTLSTSTSTSTATPSTSRPHLRTRTRTHSLVRTLLFRKDKDKSEKDKGKQHEKKGKDLESGLGIGGESEGESSTGRETLDERKKWKSFPSTPVHSTTNFTSSVFFGSSFSSSSSPSSPASPLSPSSPGSPASPNFASTSSTFASASPSASASTSSTHPFQFPFAPLTPYGQFITPYGTQHLHTLGGTGVGTGTGIGAGGRQTSYGFSLGDSQLTLAPLVKASSPPIASGSGSASVAALATSASVSAPVVQAPPPPPPILTLPTELIIRILHSLVEVWDEEYLCYVSDGEVNSYSHSYSSSGSYPHSHSEVKGKGKGKDKGLFHENLEDQQQDREGEPQKPWTITRAKKEIFVGRLGAFRDVIRFGKVCKTFRNLLTSHPVLDTLPIKELGMYFLHPHPNAKFRRLLDFHWQVSNSGLGSGTKKRGGATSTQQLGLSLDGIAGLVGSYAGHLVRTIDLSGLSGVGGDDLEKFLFPSPLSLSTSTPLGSDLKTSTSTSTLALTTLTLSPHTPLTRSHIEAILSRSPFIRKLNLRGLPSEAVDDTLLAIIAEGGWCRRLEGLDVRRCWGVTDVGILGFVKSFGSVLDVDKERNAKVMSRMKYLRIGGVKGLSKDGEEGERTPISLELMREIGRTMGGTLEVLDLQGCGIWDGHVEAIVDLSDEVDERQQQLRYRNRYLGLGSTPTSTSPPPTPSPSSSPSSPTSPGKEKVFWNEGVGGAGVIVVPFKDSGHKNGERDNNSTTGSLDPSSHPISASQIQRTHYTRLVLPRLRHLNLSSNTDLTDRAMVYLTGCTPLLEILELADIGEGMDEEGVVKLLKTTPMIRKVDLEGAGVGDGVVEALSPPLSQRGLGESTFSHRKTPGFQLDTLLLSHTSPTSESLFTLLETRSSLTNIAIDGTTRVSQSFIREFIKLNRRRGTRGAEINAIDCRCVGESLLKEFGVNGAGWDDAANAEANSGKGKKGKGKGWIRARRGERSFEGAVVVGYVDASSFEECNNTSAATTPGSSTSASSASLASKTSLATPTIAFPSTLTAVPVTALDITAAATANASDPIALATKAASSTTTNHSRTPSTSNTLYEDECDSKRIVLKCFWSWQGVDGYTAFLRERERERRKAADKGKKFRKSRGRSRGLGGALGREDSDEEADNDSRCVVM